jgi:hypothetical protein
MKMVKRMLIAIAVVALIATSVQAADLPTGVQKQDGAWPTTYLSLPLCDIPVVIDIGMYVQLIDCADKKIKLVQVTCSDMNNFPCYYDCEEFGVRANFAAVLGTELIHADPSNPVVGSWSAAFDGANDVPGDGSTVTRKVCVSANKAAILTTAPGDEVVVGTLRITVKPQ